MAEQFLDRRIVGIVSGRKSSSGSQETSLNVIRVFLSVHSAIGERGKKESPPAFSFVRVCVRLCITIERGKNAATDCRYHLILFESIYRQTLYLSHTQTHTNINQRGEGLNNASLVILINQIIGNKIGGSSRAVKKPINADFFFVKEKILID